jgi:hypothetical protein
MIGDRIVRGFASVYYRVVLMASLLAVSCANGPDSTPSVVSDIVPFVRMTAGDTRRDTFPWPVEATDGPATIRDQNPDTSWKIPVAADTVLSLDLQPWLGRTAALHSASISVEGGVTSLSVRLLDWCGATVADTLEWTDRSLPIDLAGHRAGCVEFHFATGSNAEVLSLEVLADVPADAVAEPNPEAAARTVVDGRWNGVIEGFYGVPWSWDERRRMVDLLSRTGMGTYVYCPKWDPFHRDSWRDPYPEAELARFADLVAYASKRGVTFSFGISPFVDFDQAGDDYQTLLGKVMSFVTLGAGSITILADDIEARTANPIDGAMGSMHAATVNRLLSDLRQVDPDIVMAFCPTVYSDDRMESLGRVGGDASSYLAALSELDPSIRILWTGPDTFSAIIKAADMGGFEALTGRKPLLWDNFGANDAVDGIFGRILLGPLSGREPGLRGAVAGMLHNPSIQGGLSRLTIGTFADYLIDPAGYRPADAPDFAVELETTSGASFNGDTAAARDTASFIMALFDGNALDAPGHRQLLENVSALAGKIDARTVDGAPEVEVLASLFGRMSAVESEVYHSGLSCDIVDELHFPLEKIRHEGETGLLLLEALAAKASGGDAGDVLDRAAASAYRSGECRFVFGEGEIDDLFNAVSGMPTEGGGGVLPGISVDVSECTAGVALTVTPSVTSSDAVVSGFGLPGAVSDGTSVRWTPPHAGSYEATFVATVSSDSPWVAWTRAVFICRNP